MKKRRGTDEMKMDEFEEQTVILLGKAGVKTGKLEKADRAHMRAQAKRLKVPIEKIIDKRKQEVFEKLFHLLLKRASGGGYYVIH